MNVNEIIKEEIINRASAARELREEIRINDTHIMSGCTDKGIMLYSGIELVADIMGEALHDDVYECGDYLITERWFDYGTDATDTVRFYQNVYMKKKPAPEPPHKTLDYDDEFFGKAAAIK